jgi:hypothetical protein
LGPMFAEMALLGVLPLLLEIPLDGERGLRRLVNARPAVQLVAYVYAVTMLLFLHAMKANEFIYFQF